MLTNVDKALYACCISEIFPWSSACSLRDHSMMRSMVLNKNWVREMGKYQGPVTIISILNNLFKIIILFVSIVIYQIYQQVQILISGLIFSKCPKIHIL